MTQLFHFLLVDDDNALQMHKNFEFTQDRI